MRNRTGNVEVEDTTWLNLTNPNVNLRQYPHSQEMDFQYSESQYPDFQYPYSQEMESEIVFAESQNLGFEE